METKQMTPVNKGLILALILIAYSIIIYIAIPDMEKQQNLSWVSSVLLIAGIVWACFTYARDMNHNVTFGNVFAHGFKITAVITSLFVVYTILSFTIIFPEIKDKALEAAAQKMEEQGNLSDTQIDQALEFTKKFF
ncbi:MAG TPA: DUF4199 domain-containing protein, partial [Phnomibacter sp.]|nr:DUF4199 domain-containing protein [Phnomibacter sp.]